MITWKEIEAEAEGSGFRERLVVIFRKYEGQATDEQDERGVVKVTTTSFARHMGIPQKTFARWVGLVKRTITAEDRERLDKATASQQKTTYYPNSAERERRAEQVARLWAEGYNRNDIEESLEIGDGTVVADLRARGVKAGVKRTVQQPRGRLKEKILWKDEDLNRPEPGVVRLQLVPTDPVCVINEKRADSILNDFDAHLDQVKQWAEDLQGYDLTAQQEGRLTKIVNEMYATLGAFKIKTEKAR